MSKRTLNRDIAKTESAPSRLKQFVQYAALLLVTIILGVAIYLLVESKSAEYQSVVIGNETFKLEIADNDQERTQGLSGRESLDIHGGMLFNYGSLGNWHIWMKDMHFAIDVLWLDEQGKIVAIKTDISPATYPETFGIASPSRHIIEVPAGTIERLSLRAGDIIRLN